MKCVAINNVAALCDLVHQAREAKVSLAPLGGGTQQHRLLPAKDDSWQVDLRGLNQIIDYPFDDMTITMQAGVTIAHLQRTLAEHGQTLPIDVPFPEKATLGGSIAANANGPRRFGWGTWRDYVIGISFVNDRGEEAKAGGRVVKNVAGYDLCKLMTGSFGTLGIITQITLKVRPLPQQRTIVPLEIDLNVLAKLTETIRHSRLRPVMQMVSRSHAAVRDANSKLKLYIGFDESAAAIEWQIEHLREISQFDGVHPAPPLERGDAQTILDRLTHFTIQDHGVIFQLALLPSQTADALMQMAMTLRFSGDLQADLGAGVIWGKLESSNSSANYATLVELRKLAESQSGHFTLLRFPIELVKDFPPFGSERPDWAMMRKVKQALDPDYLFNPGRFPHVNPR